MAAEIMQAIDAVIAAGLAPAAKAAGFAKHGRTFRRTVGDAIQVTHAQASVSNLGSAGKFTVNVSVFFPAAAALMSNPPASLQRPSEPDCQLRERLGFLMPERTDVWWPVDAATDRATLGTKVADAWRTYGLPWLDANSDVDVVAERFEASGQWFLAMQLRTSRGELDHARALLASLEQDDRVMPQHVHHVRGWASRHGVTPA